MFPTNSERLISISDAFSAFVYGYPSSCPRAHCTPNKSVTTLRYTRRYGPVYTGHAYRHLLSLVPWISEDRLFWEGYQRGCMTQTEGRQRKAPPRHRETHGFPEGDAHMLGAEDPGVVTRHRHTQVHPWQLLQSLQSVSHGTGLPRWWRVAGLHRYFYKHL